jgi:hypothetical protein
MMAAAAATAINTPLPPPSLFSLGAAGAARFTFAETGLAVAVAACAATGAAASANVENIANDRLPKLIFFLPNFRLNESILWRDSCDEYRVINWSKTQGRPGAEIQQS